MGAAVLGICYGEQVMAHVLGGKVQKGERGEYGFAHLDIKNNGKLLDGIHGKQQVWMSHRDLVTTAPEGFDLLARTDTCPIAAMGDETRKLYAVQFHPEKSAAAGLRLLANFVRWQPLGEGK